MINVIIDGKKLQADEGKSVLEVAQDAGIHIPTLCYHKELTPYGACRLCVVEIMAGGRPGVDASCLYKVSEGLEVKTDTARVKRVRKIVIELLLSHSPDSKKLKELAREHGVGKLRLKPKLDSANCILCGLCQRVCKEIVGACAIDFAQRGIHKKVQTPFDKVNDVCIGCGACAYLCPTEAIKIEQAY